MKKYWPAILILLVVILAAGWYLFRPELIFIDKKVHEAHPTVAKNGVARMSNISSGQFSSVAHETRGEATLIKVNGKAILRFTNFKTSNGPDVRIYLVAVPEGKSISDAVKQKQFIDLGVMKGNIGDQNYPIPSSVDINKYNAVSVWCRRFGVNFGEAQLAPSAGAP